MPSRTGGGLTVSVVIPVKDDSGPLRRCLAALSTQTVLPDEIVVVDNNSSDSSADVARSAGATVVRCEAPGIPAASATGYDAASGEIILRLDADCVPDPAWVESYADAFMRRPDIAAFTGRARFGDGPHPLRTPLAAVYLGAYRAVVVPTLGHLPLFGSNMGMRRSAWRAVSAKVHRDNGMHDDLDLSFHLGDRHRIRSLHAPIAISMRPFASARSFAFRIGNGFRTVVRHWPEDFPPVRWMRRLLLRVGFADRVRSLRHREPMGREPMDRHDEVPA